VSGDERSARADERQPLRPHGGVYTKDEALAHELLSKVNAGSVYWNCCDRVSPRPAVVGLGDSGIGLTLSSYGIQAFTRTKAWHLRSP